MGNNNKNLIIGIKYIQKYYLKYPNKTKSNLEHENYIQFIIHKS